MDMANGVCYLTDRTGVVSVLDLETGKRTLAFRGPEGVSWVSDSPMQTLYYADEHWLYEYDIASGRFAPVVDFLSDLPVAYSGTILTQNQRLYAIRHGRDVVAVTDSFVLFQVEELASGSFRVDTYSLDRRTGAVRQLLDGIDDNLVFVRDRGMICLENTVYLWTFQASDGPDVVRSAPEPVSVNLETGEIQVIHLPDGRFDEFSFAATTPDGTILLCDSLNRVYGLAPGRDTAEHWYNLPGENLLFSSDGTLVAAVDYHAQTETGLGVLYQLDLETGDLTELDRFPDASIRTLVTDGTRYGILAKYMGGDSRIFLGDLPET